MNERSEHRQEINEITKNFTRLLEKNEELNEKRHVQNEERHIRTDGKLDTLIGVITENTVELKESRKEQEHQASRQERIERKQEEQGKEVRLIANQQILITERQKTQGGKWDKIGSGAHKILTGLILAIIVYWVTK